MAIPRRKPLSRIRSTGESIQRCIFSHTDYPPLRTRHHGVQQEDRTYRKTDRWLHSDTAETVHYVSSKSGGTTAPASMTPPTKWMAPAGRKWEGFLPSRCVPVSMHVAVIVEQTSIYRDSAGVDRLERIARNFARNNHDVRLFCTGWWDEYTTVKELEGVKYHAVTRSPARTSFVARLPALLARYRPDVVHAAATPPAAVRAARAGASLAGAPLIVDWYGEDSLESRLGPPLQSPDRILTPSRLVQTMARELGAPEDRTRVIPDSIDMDLVRNTEPRGDFDIVYARRLDEDANLESLLLALAELRRRQWSAAVVGEGPKRADYETQAADLRLDDRVTFLGDRSREEKIARYRGAHAFVHTAERACFATELLWALACGCVGVVEYQEHSSAHELIEGRTRGARATSSEAVQDALVEAAGLEEQRINESFAEFNHDAMVDRYLACYEEAGAAR